MQEVTRLWWSTAPAAFESQYVTVCRSVVGFFSPFFFSFYFFFQEAEGNEASRLLKPTSASKLMHVHSVLGDFAYLIHAQHRHGGCPSVLWSSCSGWLGNSTRSSVTYVILSCDVSLSRANCTCKRARQAEERPDVPVCTGPQTACSPASCPVQLQSNPPAGLHGEDLGLSALLKGTSAVVPPPWSNLSTRLPISSNLKSKVYFYRPSRLVFVEMCWNANKEEQKKAVVGLELQLKDQMRYTRQAFSSPQEPIWAVMA